MLTESRLSVSEEPAMHHRAVALGIVFGCAGVQRREPSRPAQDRDAATREPRRVARLRAHARRPGPWRAVRHASRGPGAGARLWCPLPSLRCSSTQRPPSRSPPRRARLRKAAAPLEVRARGARLELRGERDRQRDARALHERRVDEQHDGPLYVYSSSSGTSIFSHRSRTLLRNARYGWRPDARLARQRSGIATSR